jgi:hypothetical protein
MELHDGDVLLSLQEAGARLGVAGSTLRHQALAGVLTAQLIGRSWVTTEREIERYRSEHLGKVGPKPGSVPIVAVPLDETQLGSFVHEVELQCSFALHAYVMVRASMSIPGHDASIDDNKQMRKQVEGTMAYCHAMLVHAGNLSKLFWPLLPRREKDETDAERKQRTKNQRKRGQQLREALGIKASSPLRSHTVRDHLEHYDERLETYLRKPHRGGLIDMAFTGAVQPGQEVHRLFAPGLKVFTFQRDEVDLLPLRGEIAAVRNAAREWLYQHGHWDRDDEEAWYNEEDYTLSLVDYLHPEEVAFIRERRSRDPLIAALAALWSAEPSA